MQVKFPFDSAKPVIGEASIDINKSMPDVFSYIGERFFDNYPNWAVEVIEFEPLDGKDVFVGAKARQIRNDSGTHTESIFQITDYQPHTKLSFEGITAPYRHSYSLQTAAQNQPTTLTFRFELLELELFMRPFEKLIRLAIEEGTENTVANIKNLIDITD